MDHCRLMDSVCLPLAFIDGLGASEMLLIFVLILMLFGGDKLPGFARSLGKTLGQFKRAAAGVEEEFKRALDEDERKQNQLKLPEGSATTPPPAPYDPAGPDAHNDYHHDHDHDYHSGENPTDATATPAVTPPDAVPDAEGGPVAAPVSENTIHTPAEPAGAATSTPPPPAAPAAAASAPAASGGQSAQA